MRFDDRIGSLTILSTTQIQLAGDGFAKVGGLYKNFSTLSLNIATTGLGGLDTGTAVASTYYYVYIVSNGTTVGLVASTNDSAPSGFSRYNQIGVFKTDSSSLISNIYNKYEYVFSA